MGASDAIMPLSLIDHVARKKRKGKFLYNILFKVFITLWQIDEENVETVTNFIFFGFKITVDGTAAM